MRKPLLALFAAALVLPGCGNEAPPPKPAAQPSPAAKAAPKPEAKAPAPAAPAPAPVAAPAPDPNKELAARVKQALEGVHAAGIDVTAAEGKVTLWGTAASAGERARAAQLASKIPGVKSVENKLKVVRGS